jgi:hypothetical protein
VLYVLKYGCNARRITMKTILKITDFLSEDESRMFNGGDYASGRTLIVCESGRVSWARHWCSAEGDFEYNKRTGTFGGEYYQDKYYQGSKSIIPLSGKGWIEELSEAQGQFYPTKQQKKTHTSKPLGGKVRTPKIGECVHVPAYGWCSIIRVERKYPVQGLTIMVSWHSDSSRPGDISFLCEDHLKAKWSKETGTSWTTGKYWYW